MSPSSLEAWLGAAPALFYFGFLLLEPRLEARSFPRVRGWLATGLAYAALNTSAALLVAAALPGAGLSRLRLVDLSGLGLLPGIFAGYFVMSFVEYWRHRLLHEIDFLWRTVHQVHHRPPRVDMPGALVASPVEGMLAVALSGLVGALLGLGPLASAGVGAISATLPLFEHWNVRTPRWLGYIIQRPEAHCVHHRKGFHKDNYGDLALWDILFGTFQNPDSFADPVGLDP